MKRSLLLATFILTLTGSGFAQIPKESVSVQSPNAAALGQYGDVPVSLFSGLPAVEVPLYQAQYGGIALPLTLSYHASGFRPDVHPGWVGMGWNLTAGGAITRTVKDGADEFDNINYPNGGQNGFYYKGSILSSPDWQTLPFLWYVVSQNLAPSLFYSSFDTEPDEFQFNFLNYSGKFYLTPQRQWKVKCDRPVKVELLSGAQSTSGNEFLPMPFPIIQATDIERRAGYSHSFSGFIITGEDGTRYTFGGRQEAIEYGVSFFAQCSQEWTANAWNLTKITDKNGREWVFNYETDGYINQMYISVHQDLETKTYVQTSPNNLMSPCSGSSTGNRVEAYYSGQLIRPVYLSSIQAGATRMLFTRSTSRELRYPLAAYSW